MNYDAHFQPRHITSPGFSKHLNFFEEYFSERNKNMSRLVLFVCLFGEEGLADMY